MINHVYVEIGAMYPKTIIPGGTAVVFCANTVFVVTKSQEKDSTGELEGWNFNINIYKSRFVKEKSKLPITVMYDGGVQKYSGMLDLAIETKDVVKPSNGWYQLVNPETGELLGGKVRSKDTETESFLGVVLKRNSFKEAIKDKFKLSNGSISADWDMIEDVDKD